MSDKHRKALDALRQRARSMRVDVGRAELLPSVEVGEAVLEHGPQVEMGEAEIEPPPTVRVGPTQYDDDITARVGPTQWRRR